MSSRLRLVALLLTVLGLVSCGPAASPTLPPARATLTPPPTPLPPPTATARPTPTRQPTATAVPTAAVSPSPSPEPSATPRPTAAPTAAPAATATPELVLTPLAQLPGMASQEVTVRATIAAAASFSKGFRFTLEDGTGRVTLLMWSNVYVDCWAAPELKIGATVQARGTVGQYQGEWQIEPGYGGDVKVLTTAPALPVTAIGAIHGGNVGLLLAIEGAVERSEGTSSGQRVYLNDGSGSIQVWLWQNVFDLVPDNARLLTPGTRVRAEGIVQEYQGTLELVPQVPYGVTVLP